MKYKKIILSVFVLLFLGSSLYSQNRKLDSLYALLPPAKEDSIRYKIYFNIAEIYLKSGNEKLMEVKDTLFNISKRLQNESKKAAVYNVMGRWHLSKGEYTDAKEFFFRDLEIREILSDSFGLASAYNNIGLTLSYQAKYNEAIEQHLKALSIREKTQDLKGLASTYHNIALIYDNQKKYTPALENYFKALTLKDKVNDIKGAGNTLTNIGIIYQEQGKNDSSLYFFDMALKKYESKQDTFSMMQTYINIGSTYEKLLKFEQAEKLYKYVLDYGRKKESYFLMAYSYQGLGQLFRQKKQYDHSIQYYLRALEFFKIMEATSEVADISKILSENYYTIGNLQYAYEYLENYLELKKQLDQENNERILAEMQEKYQTEQKEQSIQLLTQQNKIKDLQKNIFIVAGVMLLVLAVFMYKNIQDKKRANHLLRDKNEIISEQKDAIEKQKNSIIDSIKYAQRIQESFLVSQQFIKATFPDSFVLYKPRDIVSGDFYWFTQKNGKNILAAVDCTGHGVPGALMSMLGNRLLNEIVNIQGITDPGKILERLHISVTNDLHQSQDSQSQDGMDMFICCIEPNISMLHYASAVNSAFLIENNELITLKGNYNPIGGFRLNEESGREFKTFSRPILPNSKIYMFSDGYVDQFNEELKKKFGSANLKKLILDTHHLTFDKQMKIYNSKLETWQGTCKQIDDILLMGVKIS